VDKTLFNLHDLVLLLTVFECFALAWVVYNTRKDQGIVYLLLASFFVAHAFISLHELILWGASFRHWVLDISPNIFFAFNVSYQLDGPLIYLFVLSQLNKSFQLKKSYLVHIVPAVLMLGYFWWAFWGLPLDAKTELIVSHDIAYSNHYVITDLLGKLLRLTYIGYSAYIVKQYLTQAAEAASTRIKWQQYFFSAFFIIVCAETLLTSIKVYGLKYSINLDLLQIIGLSDYYLKFALVNYVIYIMVIEAVNSGGIKKPKKVDPVDMQLVAILEEAMKEQKLYLNPNLSFERLAEQINVPSKDLSNVINRHFNVNFYEYINAYRINEARGQLVSSENKGKNITDIFYDAGFNSKSVYNTLFKKNFNMTPSQFRKENLSK